MKLSGTNGRGLDHFQHLAKGQGLGPESESITTTTTSWISTSNRRPALQSATAAADHIQQQDPGDTSGEAIPVPIPNTAVKLSRAEDTERAAFRENRSSPGFCASCGPAILPGR